MNISSMAKFRAPGRKVLSVILAMLLVFVPLLQNEVEAASLEDIIMIVWAAIKGCGIQLYGTASDVLSFLNSQVSEFCNDANQTVSSVISGFRYSVNSLGEFIINDVFVDFLNDFVPWFQNKYNLQNNSNKQLTSSTVRLDGLSSYSLPIQLNRSNLLWTWTVYISTSNIYCIFYKETADTYNYKLSFWSHDDGEVKRVRQVGDGTPTETILDLNETADNGIFWARDTTAFDNRNYDFSAYDVYLWDDVHEAYTSLSDVVMPEPPIYALTTVIEAPEYNADFVFGDGAVINIGSDWGASIYDLFDQIRRLIGDLSNQITIYYHELSKIEEQVPSPSDVTNLPAGTIYNINGIYQDSNGEGGLRFGGIWHYVTDWVEDFNEAAPIVWYVVTSSPGPIVNLAYATIVLTIVIGFIHKARSH